MKQEYFSIAKFALVNKGNFEILFTLVPEVLKHLEILLKIHCF